MMRPPIPGVRMTTAPGGRSSYHPEKYSHGVVCLAMPWPKDSPLFFSPMFKLSHYEAIAQASKALELNPRAVGSQNIMARA
jgi:hypothetical protein